MPARMVPWIALLLVNFLATSLSAQMPTTVKVEAPTRIDWEFAASAFGSRALSLPNDYDSKEQRYQLFVPKDYNKEKAWPLVVFISPTDQPAGWGSFKNVCTSEGILFCSPFKAGNNCAVGQRTRIVLDMFDDVRRHYNIDPDQTYLGGMSGGGRMTCSLGFRLPEYFAGLIPVCGINPMPQMAYLRHNIQDHLSVAFVTGTTDFNRKENEEYMHPFLQELGVRTKLWIPNVGHTMPPPAVLTEVMAWLKEDLPRRTKYRMDYPGISIKADSGPTTKEKAIGMLESAQTELAKPGRQWHAMSLLQGVKSRYSKTEESKAASALLKKISRDEDLLKTGSDQKADDEIRFLSSFAKALQRFGRPQQALPYWESLAKDYPDTPAGKKALAEVRRIKGD